MIIKEGLYKDVRKLKTIDIQSDLIVIGGGLSGSCCAITAARKGINVTLVQDRPVLGGNSSSEIRLWILGATSHMGNNNRWAREGGVINELLIENTYRNPEGNPLIWDTILLEKVTNENRIQLLLNTAVFHLEKKDAKTISSVTAFCSQNSTLYHLSAPLFADLSGDGIAAFLSGAAYRMGSETSEEFSEGFAPDQGYGELLGHTLYFYSKDTGREVEFHAPSFAIKHAEEISKIRSVSASDQGCRFWWIEYGGRLDTIHESETIKWELWRIVYGIWDYVKNSGNYPEARNLTLEWVGTIPGKRESRRFEGHYMLTQQDIINQHEHYDAVAFGGWAIDLHPADGVYSDQPSCSQWHTKGIYQIPYRCYISRDIENLFIGGRIMSTSHVAFGSTRVMATCAHGAQAIGMAAGLCIKRSLNPGEIASEWAVKELQEELNLAGQSIPGYPLLIGDDLVRCSGIEASSTMILEELRQDGTFIDLEYSCAQMLPLEKDTVYSIGLLADADEKTDLVVQFRISSKPGNFTPDMILETHTRSLVKGNNTLTIEFKTKFDTGQYGFICFLKNPFVRLATSDVRITGILSVYNKFNKAVSNHGIQDPPEDIGVERFEFWTPERRPGGKNLALKIQPPIQSFTTDNLKNGLTRPNLNTSSWVAALEDENPKLVFHWGKPFNINEIIIYTDPDYDHPMESVLMGHPERRMPFCIRNLMIQDAEGRVLFRSDNNYQAIVKISLPENYTTSKLTFHMKKELKNVPVSLFEVKIL